jgi:branched-chain amino acid transport system permease protein
VVTKRLVSLRVCPSPPYKIASLIISAAFAGLGGALYAHYQLQVSPQLFAVVTSITIITMVYVGGMGTIFGPVGGVFVAHPDDRRFA